MVSFRPPPALRFGFFQNVLPFPFRNRKRIGFPGACCVLLVTLYICIALVLVVFVCVRLVMIGVVLLVSIRVAVHWSVRLVAHRADRSSVVSCCVLHHTGKCRSSRLVSVRLVLVVSCCVLGRAVRLFAWRCRAVYVMVSYRSVLWMCMVASG